MHYYRFSTLSFTEPLQDSSCCFSCVCGVLAGGDGGIDIDNAAILLVIVIGDCFVMSLICIESSSLSSLFMSNRRLRSNKTLGFLRMPIPKQSSCVL